MSAVITEHMATQHSEATSTLISTLDSQMSSKRHEKNATRRVSFTETAAEQMFAIRKQQHVDARNFVRVYWERLVLLPRQVGVLF